MSSEYMTCNKFTWYLCREIRNYVKLNPLTSFRACPPVRPIQ
jgi:hypothetical protein